MQDLNPSPWGALDRFQAHFIVRKEVGRRFSDYLTKTQLHTQGRFGAKTIVKVRWTGSGALTSKLNEDDKLNELLAKQSLNDATIHVEPTPGAVRIRGKWDNHIAFGITRELYDIYDTIAGHIKSI